MENKSLNDKYYGRVYIPHLDIQLDAILIPDEYLLYGLQELDSEGKGNWHLLHGEFEELGKVTFMHCFQVLYLDNRGRVTAGLQFIKMFAGVHLQDHAEAFISSVTLSSGALDEWLCKDKDRIGNLTGLTLVNIETGDLKIRVDCNKNSDSDVGNEVLRVEIEMQFLKALNQYNFARLYHKLQNLILFLTNEDPDLKLLYYNDFRLFGIRRFQYFDRDSFTDSMEFSFTQIQNELENIFLFWFEKQKLDNVRDLLLERKYNPDLSKERYFLNMCVALESFHRRFINNKVPLVDNLAVEKRDQIKKSLEEDPELLKWFKEKSASWNSPTLYDRLNDLKDEYDQIVRGLFKIPIEELIRNVKKCRDHLAHDGEYEMIFQDEVELFLVGYSLEMLLYVLLYKFHGISEDSMVQKLQLYAHQNLRHLCTLNDYS